MKVDTDALRSMAQELREEFRLAELATFQKLCDVAATLEDVARDEDYSHCEFCGHHNFECQGEAACEGSLNGEYMDPYRRIDMEG